jgi:hypothetical protein
MVAWGNKFWTELYQTFYGFNCCFLQKAGGFKFCAGAPYTDANTLSIKHIKSKQTEGITDTGNYFCPCWQPYKRVVAWNPDGNEAEATFNEAEALMAWVAGGMKNTGCKYAGSGANNVSGGVRIMGRKYTILGYYKDSVEEPMQRDAPSGAANINCVIKGKDNTGGIISTTNRFIIIALWAKDHPTLKSASAAAYSPAQQPSACNKAIFDKAKEIMAQSM